jgi:hypothetical protein
MEKNAYKKVSRASCAQWLMATVLFSSGAVQASEAELDLGYGFGWDDNIFYTDTNEQDEKFGILDVDFDYEKDLTTRLSLELNAVYEDKHFNNESDARDRYFSAWTQLKYQRDHYAVGIQIDPQYSQFVTSDTDGGLILPGKQRINTLKARVFTEVDVGSRSSVELGFERKEKDYRDSDSDYDANIIDIRLRNRLSDSVRLDIGAEREKRDYDNRLAITADGTSVAGKTLDIERTSWFVQGIWEPTDHQKYSLQYKRRKNEDDFQEFYGNDKDQFILRAKYHWDNDISFETKIKYSEKSYDKQLDDNLQSLDEDKSGVNLELEVPMTIILGSGWDKWYSRMSAEWDDLDSGRDTGTYQKSGYWITLHRVFN